MEETEKIKARYEKRRTEGTDLHENKLFIENVVSERETVYSQIIGKNFKEIQKLKVIEIGAGGGANINFFLSAGVKSENIYAIELMPDRSEVLKKRFPGIKVITGDALEIDVPADFDIVFQSLVFTSILNADYKMRLARKMWNMLKPGGIILWYDFRFNNPSNKDVKGVGKSEIRNLFSFAREINFYNVTLAPPVGRRVGSFYKIINKFFPFLRTHLIAVIKK